MCGLVFKFNRDGTSVVNDVLTQYDKQKYRGQQGFGVFDGERRKVYRVKTEDKILKYLVSHDSSHIMFHHRFPTSTINVPQAAHPLRTGKHFGDTEYIMVHNGVIRNSGAMYGKHSRMGITYSTMLPDVSFNDSESLLWELALTIEGRQQAIESYGDMAFIMAKLVKGQLKTLYFGRQGRPLQIFKSKATLELSSEGRGVPIPINMLHTYDYNSASLTTKRMELPAYAPFDINDYKPSKHKNPLLQPGYRPTEYYPQRKTYQSYDSYYAEKRKAHAEEVWQRLRGKYQMSHPNEPNHIIDEGAYIANNNTVNVDRAMSDKQLYEPTTAQIQDMAMEYLIAAGGNFEMAYGSLEFDYGNKLEDCEGQETLNDIREQLLMEKALEFINLDPEYLNENSTSTLYETLWSEEAVHAQLKLLTA